jgi:hypothetical protein
MTADYQRGYAKGYATGCKRSDAANARERERADQAVQRAERAEKQQGLGHCEDCAYWIRGDRPRRGWEGCAWGICEAPRAAGTPWGTWACIDASVREPLKIQTTPRFGCVMFKKEHQ